MIGEIRKADVVIIGGGPAGLAAACAAKEAGIESVLVLERDDMPGGILNQCIHNGFGLHTFKEELTGPEYAARFIKMAEAAGVSIFLGTMVLNITADKVITALNKSNGVFSVEADAVILAMGCRERPRGALNIPGTRPDGIYTAGMAQRLVNMEGYLPGKEVVILGSGDIGLIMARRMTLEGAKVKVVAEIMPYSGGLKRNIVQCLDDFGIPLKLSHTVTDIKGDKRVESVVISQVDEFMRPISGTEEEYTCDTLLLSVGLLPENELSQSAGVGLSPVTGGPYVDENLSTNVPGIFACGNVLHVHDLVDYVSEEAAEAGRQAAAYVKKLAAHKGMTDGAEIIDGASGRADSVDTPSCSADSADIPSDHADLADASSGRFGLVDIQTDGGVRYTVPSVIHKGPLTNDLTIRFRVGSVIRNAYRVVYINGERVLRSKKPILTPGEMETLVVKASAFDGEVEAIRVVIEEA